ncbi:heavy metal translocating P-type ATPase [Sinomicrobium weinanense]|uniref:Heavy metal translocating P-type ATPase metal-binding domain-containing protein n=1 Tax=Sinomicrobium weinanense TaxID=2842200 RepID=A0A926JVH8_9FLAO|nr:heavy metal translocating P-type ATPase metal-binding domain-containing protein [Sinomicrobium weinanense]MBC9798332.1 heavy metal translocating P-type ATPase metal-binding domain-containing protein [Sinomicrobium weinanense]MBU3121783.1 heavy metal translocating P-type ATPase metal-binding domain-containing protein [Sinomicrobium weinanense]
MENTDRVCFHCGASCTGTPIVRENRDFCCSGCRTVYDILSENGLEGYYSMDRTPGARPGEVSGKYDFLDNEAIAEKLLEFYEDNIQVVNLRIPGIHCSSCIWVLENLKRLNKGIRYSQVDFPGKELRISYDSRHVSLKEVVWLLGSIGYEPRISLENYEDKPVAENRALLYKLGIAGFAFGNVMLLSFPEYFEMGEFWLEQYKPFFRWLMFALSLPAVFYVAGDYFVSSYRSLRSGLLNIDVPIALGIAVMFLRSTADIVFGYGPGFFDSLTGLIFFMTIGKYLQQRTYASLSFERDYKSYFPIAVTRISGEREEAVQLYDIKKGDRLLIRNEELIPVDCRLIKGNALIDYSFVTGEARPVSRSPGAKLFAGGRQVSGLVEVEAVRSVSQSYLTKLWSSNTFKEKKEERYTNITNTVSRYFTPVVLTVALLSLSYWLWLGKTDTAFNAFTAVLIIACPCALALSAPFALGNLLRIFGRRKFYLKNASVIERLATIDTVIFDKTGTITSAREGSITYEGEPLNRTEEDMLKSTLRNSAHPLSRQLYTILKSNNILTPDEYEECIGKGIEATYREQHIRIGSGAFAGNEDRESSPKTSVHINTNNRYRGKFIFGNRYRQGLSSLFRKLSGKYRLVILSGDNESERKTLEKMLPPGVQMCFNRKPEHKLNYVRQCQQNGARVMMVGDGLNDAGALQQSNAGVVIAEDTNAFSPACDAILDASRFREIHEFLRISKKGMQVVKISFALSFLYNIAGLSFAVTGKLSPVIAAILMPLSSVTIVIFVTLLTNFIGREPNNP